MTAAHPLSGIRVLELAGLAPVPFTGMVLSDFGADVLRVDRSAGGMNPDVLARGKRSIAVSLKSPAGIALIKSLLSPLPAGCSSPTCKCSKNKISKCGNNKNKDLWRADILLDPFRPGVLERLGLGPTELLKLNPRLIIARLTGYRRDEGPYAKMAGHDINYIALSGVLSMLGGERPAFPANLLGDFAGGGMVAVVGIMMALFEREKSGLGQVIDIDMVTGTRYVSTFAALMARPSLGLPLWDRPRGQNVVDGGAPWYQVYKTSDGKFMSVGAIESQFYEILLTHLLASSPASIIPTPRPLPSEQHDRETWPKLASFFTAVFLTRSQAEWTSIFLTTDACVAPILEMNEVDSRGLSKIEPGYSDADEEGGVPVPAPRLSRSPARDISAMYGGGEGGGDNEGEGFLLEPGKDTRSVLIQAGLSHESIERLIEQKVIEVTEDDHEPKSKL